MIKILGFLLLVSFNASAGFKDELESRLEEERVLREQVIQESIYINEITKRENDLEMRQRRKEMVQERREMLKEKYKKQPDGLR